MPLLLVIFTIIVYAYFVACIDEKAACFVRIAVKVILIY